MSEEHILKAFQDQKAMLDQYAALLKGPGLSSQERQDAALLYLDMMSRDYPKLVTRSQWKFIEQLKNAGILPVVRH